MDKKILLAHRGYSEISPENTKKSFDLAVQNNFDGIEIDVHQTKDQNLVIIHDETIDRTSNKKSKICDLTLKQLKKIDFGNWFKNSKNKQTILTFQEFLNEYGNKVDFINVEIKTDNFHYQGIEKRILEVEKKVKIKAQIIYSSFNFETLKILHKLNSELNLAFLCVNWKDVLPIYDQIIKICKYINPWFKSLIDPKQSKHFQKLNLKIMPWTFDKRNTNDKWSKNSLKLLPQILKIKNVYALISNSKLKIN